MLLLRDLAFESVLIVDDSHYYVDGRSAGYGWGRTNVTSSPQVFWASTMLLRTRVDRSSIAEGPIRPSAVLLLRQAIELRLRNALGIFAIWDDRGNQLQLKGGTLLDAIIKLPKGNLEMNVDATLLKGVVRWANRYVHGGLRPRVWLVEFACHLVAPLFARTTKPDGSWNLFGGVRIKRDFYDSVDQFLARSVFSKREITVERLGSPEAVIEDQLGE
jgi:hypothetical protein